MSPDIPSNIPYILINYSLYEKAALQQELHLNMNFPNSSDSGRNFYLGFTLKPYCLNHLTWDYAILVQYIKWLPSLIKLPPSLEDI